MQPIMILSVACLLAVGVVFSSCHSPKESNVTPATESASAPTTRVAGVEAGWELAPDGAKFSARQNAGEVTIHATGKNPNAGYEVKLAPSLLRIWPPQYLLVRHATGDVAAQVITPYDVSTSFKSSDPVGEVVVTDAAGRHQIKVDQSE